MGTRAQRPAAAVRKSKAAVQAVQPLRVAARVDGFLEVVADPRPGRRPVREKVERRLKQLHPMD